MDFELTNKITPLVPAIEFHCVVAGKELTATVTQVGQSIIEMAYRVCFSDGHEAFYVPGMTGTMKNLEGRGNWTNTKMPCGMTSASFRDWKRAGGTPISGCR